MIPRFNYAYSLRDAWNSLASLAIRQKPDNTALRALFPASDVYCIGSARAGINYTLRAFNLKPRARIGIQPYTCSSVLAAIVAVGHTPVFIDINQQLTIDSDDLRRKLPLLDALIVTHTFGMLADIRQIKQLIGELPVIEDCAHAFFSRYEGVHAGNFFDAAVFSFGNGKFPSFGGGGLLVINNKKYTARIETQLADLKQPNLLSELTYTGNRILKSILHSRVGGGLIHRLLGGNFISSRNKQVSVYPGQEHLPYRSVVNALQKQIDNFAQLALQQQANARYLIGRNRVHYTILDAPDAGNAFAVVLLSKQRNDLYNHLLTKKIGAGRHFQYARLWALRFGYESGECPLFEQLVDKVLTVPCHFGLTQNDLDVIDEGLNEYAQVMLLTNEESSN